MFYVHTPVKLFAKILKLNPITHNYMKEDALDKIKGVVKTAKKEYYLY